MVDCDRLSGCVAARGQIPVFPPLYDCEQRSRPASREAAVGREQHVLASCEGKAQTSGSCWNPSHRTDGSHRGLGVAAVAAADAVAAASAAVAQAIRRSRPTSSGHHRSSRATTRRPLVDGTCTELLDWCLW